MIEKINLDISVLKSIQIKDVIDIEMLQRFQDNFAESMNIASITVDINGVPVTKNSSYTNFCEKCIQSTAAGKRRCAASHKRGGEEAARTGKPYVFKCHAGLIDFAAPIMVDGFQIGTVLGGQILTEEPEMSRFMQTAEEIGLDESNLIEPLKEIKVTTYKSIEAAAEVLFTITNALSKIGFRELKLKRFTKDLEIEVKNKNLLLDKSKEYNRTKTQFFSIISHELKTPLNIIFSSLQLMESIHNGSSSLHEDGKFSKYSEIMKQNCYRMIKLVNNFIDMNKIELGFSNLKLKNCNVVKFIEDITLSVVEYGKLKNINIIFDTETEEIITAFDLGKLERILLNLLSNAMKFTPAHGTIYVNIYDKNEYILISVMDTGIGIPENMLDKIFDPFILVDSSLKRNAEGSGIGLSIVKSLVEMHGGRILVKSQIGIGSEFIIKLPINQ
ncbi:MAG: PocR ligand-binding domain-containing protein, partial [Bacillota bacterium]|nr:PocR ligand-binding domain-containing protein [Bacillota bacterium]